MIEKFTTPNYVTNIHFSYYIHFNYRTSLKHSITSQKDKHVFNCYIKL
jgi:hypothetical protein